MIVLGTDAPVQTDKFMQEYLDTVVQWVRLIAPQANFVFRPSRGAAGAFSDLDLRDAVSELIDARPDILLITLGPLDSHFYAERLNEAATAGTLVVIAAGNDPKHPVPFANSPLLDRFLVVSAVTMTGEPAVFTSSHAKAVWAPGVDLPVTVGDDMLRRSGTTYAAAVAAGLAARVLAERQLANPDEAVRLLRSSAKPAPGRTTPAILNLDAALKAG